MLRTTLLLLAALSTAATLPIPTTYDNFTVQKVNGTATLKLPAVAKYHRSIQNTKTWQEETHVYTVCNGKNKGKCGFWMNSKTKKKVPSGVTTYNKTKKALIIKKFKKSDQGFYQGGKKQIDVFIGGNMNGGSGGGGGAGVIVGPEYEG